MELTPVRIRGKKRKQPAVVTATSNSQSAAPSSQASSSSSSKRAKTSKAPKSAKLKKKATTPAMPTLQGLPQELLEMVFLYSMNLSLPRSSPSLGRALSSRSITMEFVMRSFFHTVDHKTNIRDRKVTSDPELQSQLLACRFFTWDFFLAYVQRAHDAMIKLRGKAWEKTGVPVPGVEVFEGLWPYRFTKITYLGFAEGFRVPEKLLHGPWGQDKMSLVYVLVGLNGEVDWEASLAGETAKIGLREAIEEHNERAVAALSVLLGVPRAIDTDMLRYAVMEHGCDVRILRHLVYNAQILADETPKESLNFLDPQLWTWADANPEQGEVLKDILKKANDYSLKFYFEGEENMTKIVSFPYSGPKFDARTGFDNMVRELLVNLYRNYGRKITRRRVRRSLFICTLPSSE